MNENTSIEFVLKICVDSYKKICTKRRKPPAKNFREFCNQIAVTSKSRFLTTPLTVRDDAKASLACETLSLSTIMSSPAAREQSESPIRPESRITTSNDEREPLLGNESAVSTKEDGDDINWRWYAFYGVLSVVGIALLALLIKGFIDSGDTDVSGLSG